MYRLGQPFFHIHSGGCAATIFCVHPGGFAAVILKRSDNSGIFLMGNHIAEKSFFYLQRTVIVEKKVLNRVLKMPKRPLADCGFKTPYFWHDFSKIM